MFDPVSSTPLISLQHVYGLNTALEEAAQTGTGALTHNPLEGSLVLSAGAGFGSSAVRSNYAYYTSGRQVVGSVGLRVVGGCPRGQTRRWGYHCDQDGAGFLQTSEGLFTFRRSNVSGFVVDTDVPLYGVDPTQYHNYCVAYFWPSGRLVWYVDGREVADYTQAPIFGLPLAPLSVDVTAAEANSNPGEVRYYTGHVDLETTQPAPPPSSGHYWRTISTGATLTPVYSIRPIALISGEYNRAVIIPRSLLAESIDRIEFSLIADATLTGATWGVGPLSGLAVEVDTAATSLSGGTRLVSGSVRQVGLAPPIDLGTIFADGARILQRRPLSGSQPTLTVAVRNLGGGSADAGVTTIWGERL